MKKTLHNILSAFLIVMLLMQLCACQESPKEEPVTSKVGGTFDSSKVDQIENEDTVDAAQSVEITDDFYSTDGLVHFILNLDANSWINYMPVVEVAPHYLTEEDAKRVSEVLFKDLTGYEAQPLLCPTYSKQEIQQCCARWAPYTSNEGIKSLLGMEDDFIVEVVKRKVEDFTAQYENAPDGCNRQPCKWKFRKEAYYNFTGEEAVEAESYLDNDMIMANFSVNGAIYDYNVATRDKSDYKLNDITAYFHTAGSPMSIDAAIYQAKFCRTGLPGETELAARRAQAESMLAQMNLGEWSIDLCEVQEGISEFEEYFIHITAVPVLNGVPAVSVPQITNLKSENVYASNYYVTMADFLFSANGDLISFQMASPIDIRQVVDENAKTLTFEELLSKAKNHLILSDAATYMQPIMGVTNEEMVCTVNVDRLDYGLLRIKVPDSDESYYYVPGFALAGNVTVESRDGSYLYYSSGSSSTLIALNALDGTIIELKN